MLRIPTVSSTRSARGSLLTLQYDSPQSFSLQLSPQFKNDLLRRPRERMCVISSVQCMTDSVPLLSHPLCLYEFTAVDERPSDHSSHNNTTSNTTTETSSSDD